MKKLLFICSYLSLLSVLFSSCGKEADFKPNISSTPITGAGAGPGSGSGSGPTPAGDSYQPVSKNSTWSYQNTEGTTIVDTTVVTATGIIKLINGKSFNALAEERKAVKDTSYYLIDNHNYTNNSQNFADGVGTDILYLNDTEAVGYSWSGKAIEDNPLVTGTYTGKIIEKNITKTILGKAYANIIHTQVLLHLTLFGFGGDVTCDFYVAKGIGVIQLDTDDGTDKTSSKIISYSIK